MIPTSASGEHEVGRDERLVAGLCSLVAGGWRLPAIVLVLSAAPAVLGFAGGRSALVGPSCALAAGLLALDGRPGDRRTVAGLFVLAFAVRSFALMAATWWLGGSGGPYLSPDGATYWATARAMANGTFDLTAGPLATFGSYDVASYYYFSGLARFFDGELFAVQLTNAGLSALSAPLAFSIARLLSLRFAATIGLVVAVHPSLTYHAAINLLKDPSVMTASLFVAWAAVRLAEGGLGIGRAASYVLPAAPVYAYLRLGRFYTAAFLAASFVGAALLLPALNARRRGGSRSAEGGRPRSRGRVAAPVASLLGLLALFGGVEVAVVAAGWPPGPVQLTRLIGYVGNAPMMRDYAPGELSSRATAVVVRGVANVVRRLYGPFVWVLPENWDRRALVAADYFLYPGTVLWYALLPFLAVGLASSAWALARGEEGRTSVAALLLFSLTYMALFLMINLSHRQREDVLPFLLVFASLGLTSVLRWRSWRPAYTLYWAGIVAMAAMHLAARSRLAS